MKATVSGVLEDLTFKFSEGLDKIEVGLHNTARPRDTRILVLEKNRAAQNRASRGLFLCTK